MESAQPIGLTDGASWRTRMVAAEDDTAEDSGRY
jgi:hypothetical protein